MAVARATVAYFALVFGAGFVLGPLRVLWLEPSVGPAAAIVIELPILITVMVFAALVVPRWFALRDSTRPLVLIGIGACALVIVADFTVGLMMRDLTVSQQVAALRTPAGSMYLFALALFAAMPVLVNRRPHGRATSTRDEPAKR